MLSTVYFLSAASTEKNSLNCKNRNRMNKRESKEEKKNGYDRSAE